jgi:hypothetical protein
MDYMVKLKATQGSFSGMESQLEVKPKTSRPLTEEEAEKLKTYALLNRPSPPF